MGEGASSEPRTTDLTAIEEAIWRGVTDDEPIPDHWPQWLIEVALDVVRVVEQQPGTEGVTYADVERGARGLCDFVWGRDSWGRLNEATRHDALNRARAVLTAALPPQPPEETLRNIAHELARALRARIVEVEGRQPPPNGILWTAEKFLASLPPESPEHQPDDEDTVYGCLTDGCSERLKGICDEATFCSVCQRPLSPLSAHDEDLVSYSAKVRELEAEVAATRERTVAGVVELLRERLKQRGRHMTPESKAFRRGWEAATECIESHFKAARTGGQT